MKAGDVIARGNPIFDPNHQVVGCDVDFGIESPKFGSGSYAVGLKRDENCVFSIADVDESQTGPELIARQTPAPRGVIARVFDRLLNILEPALGADFGPKRETNYCWSYGYGGLWDRLGEVRGFLDFSWTGSSATWQSAYSYCDPHWQTYWYAGVCANVFWQANGGWVEQMTDGDFYWQPPGDSREYQHTIRNDRQGDQYGNASCGGYIKGSIPNGSWMHCYTHQPPPCAVGTQCFSTAPHDQGY